MKNYDLIQLLLKYPMDRLVSIATKDILEDDSNEEFNPRAVNEVYCIDARVNDSEKEFPVIVIQSNT